MTPINPLTIATTVAEVLERLDIPYVIGGSVAASVLGEPRSTLDLDVMIDAGERQVRQLVGALAAEAAFDLER